MRNVSTYGVGREIGIEADGRYPTGATVVGDEATSQQTVGKFNNFNTSVPANETIYGIMVGRQDETCLAYLPFPDPYDMTSGNRYDVIYNLKFSLKGLQPV